MPPSAPRPVIGTRAAYSAAPRPSVEALAESLAPVIETAGLKEELFDSCIAAEHGYSPDPEKVKTWAF